MKKIIAVLLLVVLAVTLTGCGSSAWVCSNCRKTVEKSEFCPDCGHNKAERATCAMCKYQPENEWPSYCPKCGKAFMNYSDIDNAYNQAMALMKQEQYESAISILKKLNGYSDSEAKITACEKAIPERDYAAAKKLMEAGKYEEAIKAFKALNGYSDSASQITACETAIAAAAAAREPYTKVGNIVTYGHYEQDNNTANGKEAIEWLVLDYDAASRKSLLLSRYGLDAHRFNAETYQGWAKSEIHSWLKSIFLNAAFTAEEQKGIVTTKISTPAFGGISGGPDTQDKVFLLSLEEAMEYGGHNSIESARDNITDKLKAVPTAYAVANGAWKFDGTDESGMLDGTGCCSWWLRSPCDFDYYACLITAGGSLYARAVDDTYEAVRPAFWLNLDSIIP